MLTVKTTSVLLILDGWGCREESTSNAIAQANTPNWDRLVDEYPVTQVLTSGAAVGLPDGQMGNSEVGHMNIGAGRVIDQNFTRINKAISDGSFSSTPLLSNALKDTQTRSGALHIMGLLSPGGVHSHEEHLKAVFDLACEKGIKSIYFHLFLDGRDTPPRSAKNSIKSINSAIKNAGRGQIATLCGRYYAMDRDQRWDRTAETYRLIVEGQGKHQYDSALEALEAAYEIRNENDEFIQPTVINNDNSDSIRVSSDDTLIFMNFRPDRARQLTQAFVNPNLNQSWQTHVHPNNRFLTLTHYSDDLDVQVLFPPNNVKNSLGEHLSYIGKTQLRIAETEKYAHVTYFFNGGKEQPFKGEDRILVPSPDVATYDLLPEMNCKDVTEKLISAINSQSYDLIVCNYANGDMVGHSGNLEAAIKAVEAVDSCLGHVVQAVKEINGNCIITADHGNVEFMQDPETGAPHTSHTNLPVPLVLISEAKRKLVSNIGVLADIAPTLLDLMNLEQPEEISGTSLLLNRFKMLPSHTDQLEMHPLRSLLYEEMHSRPFQIIPSPARISHLSVQCNEEQMRAQFKHLQQLCEYFDSPVPEQDVPCYQGLFGDLQVRREKHTEFVSYTFIWLKGKSRDPFAETGTTHLPSGWLDGIAGQVVAAFHLSVEDARKLPEPSIPEVKSFFEEMRLVGSQPSCGAAQVWTTYQMHSDGFGRFLIYNREMSDSQLGRLVQRLVEIESYRLMTLLGLPLARSISPHLQQMDQQLAELTQTLSENVHGEDGRLLLSRLTELASQVEAYRAQSTFRFNATKAYQDLVISRINDLREDEVSGHLTLQEFIVRRMNPAVRACQTVADRLEDLSRRIDRVSDMLRTQIELSIQGQNKELLSSMDKRSKIQLMMQHTVEGLSVAAISYYSIGLVKIFLGVLYDQGIKLDKSLALGISMPIVIVMVVLITRRIHSRFSKLADESVHDK